MRFYRKFCETISEICSGPKFTSFRVLEGLPLVRRHSRTKYVLLFCQPMLALRAMYSFFLLSGGMINGTSSMSLGSDESADGLSTASQETTIIRDSKDDFDLKTHSRSFSGVTTASQQIRCDKFQISEIRDILLCFLFVIKYLGEESLISWWQQSHYNTVLYFFSAIEYVILSFPFTDCCRKLLI